MCSKRIIIIGKKKPAPKKDPQPPRYRNRVKELRVVRASEIHGAPWNWRTHPDEQAKPS
jgi:hypothetical protein